MREGTCLGLELLAMIPCCCPTRLKATNTAVLITVLCWPDGWGSPLAPEHTAAAAHPHLPQHQATDLDAQGISVWGQRNPFPALDRPCMQGPATNRRELCDWQGFGQIH